MTYCLEGSHVFLVIWRKIQKVIGIKRWAEFILILIWSCFYLKNFWLKLHVIQSILCEVLNNFTNSENQITPNIFKPCILLRNICNQRLTTDRYSMSVGSWSCDIFLVLTFMANCAMTSLGVVFVAYDKHLLKKNVIQICYICCDCCICDTHVLSLLLFTYFVNTICDESEKTS